MNKAETILARGLSSGYASAHDRTTVSRGPFILKSEDIPFAPYSGHYSDQWIAGRVGGGQEIAQCENEIATRVFAGGIVKPDMLNALGIEEADVLGYLKTSLTKYADVTRLHENVAPEPDGDWQYAYKVAQEYPDFPLTVGVETIRYKGHPVFLHVFLNTPVV